jgi:transcriptional regulator with XRE-family HTH domain
MAIKHESRAYFRALGAHVSELRKERNMTQAELARALGVSQQTVFAYELGDRRVSVLILAKLAKVFGVPVEELMGLTKTPAPKRQRVSKAAIQYAERFMELRVTQRRFVKDIITNLLERNQKRAAGAN